MTSKEAKSCIKTIEMLRRLAYNIHGVMDVIDADNCEKIIKALEQECVGATQKCVGNALDMCCDDAISRQAVIDILEKEGHKWGNDYRDWVDAIEEIKKLPHEDCECDNFGYTISTYTANIEPYTEYEYCPNCGCWESEE